MFSMNDHANQSVFGVDKVLASALSGIDSSGHVVRDPINNRHICTLNGDDIRRLADEKGDISEATIDWHFSQLTQDLSLSEQHTQAWSTIVWRGLQESSKERTSVEFANHSKPSTFRKILSFTPP